MVARLIRRAVLRQVIRALAVVTRDGRHFYKVVDLDRMLHHTLNSKV